MDDDEHVPLIPLPKDLRDSGFEGDVTRGLAKAFTRLKQSKFRRISLGGCSLTDEGKLLSSPPIICMMCQG